MTNGKNVQIAALEIQNVKRIKALRIDCSGKSLVVVGGKNGQGKTSVLDSIAFALGGEKYRPSDLQRDGAVADAQIRLRLSNGLLVERKGKNAALKVTDPDGNKTGQQLLNEFVSYMAIDLPKFLNASDSDRAKQLLSILGIGDELERLEREERKLYDRRHEIGRIADRKQKHADELPCYDELPAELISASALIKSQQAILAKNGENQRKREKLRQLLRDETLCVAQVEDLREKLDKAEARLAELQGDISTASKSIEQLQDESTAELEAQLADIESTNAKITANLDKAKAQDDALAAKTEYAELSAEIETIRASRMALLEGADLPLPGLTVEDGKLVYNGHPWDCMSGAEQLRVGTAIARQLNPACGFVLLDKAEQFDLDTLREFGAWLESEGLQAIATRVSTGDECSIILEDGQASGEELFTQDAPADDEPKWTPGSF
jgi:predicted ATP-dependent endonuclease of OLD family